MNENKKHVAILCGGQSAEHEVSLVSAKNIADALDKSKYEVVLIGISKKGEWYYCENTDWLPTEPGVFSSSVEQHGTPINIRPGKTENNIINSKTNKPIKVDIFFPIVHGTYGEDGTLQGLLKLLNKPYVGTDTLGSSIAMDKDIMKRLFINSNIPTADYKTFYKHQKNQINYEDVTRDLGTPIFIKPANLGSSIGISKAKNEKEFDDAINHAFEYDNKIIVEEAIIGRELECAVLGNENPDTSAIGEVCAKDGFYDYKAKYIDKDGAKLIIPAELDEETKSRLRKAAFDTFTTLGCEGLSRVDMFLTPENKILVNEINTLPGFTKISMYPSLWNESGIEYQDLINKLLELGFKRHKRDLMLKNNIKSD